MACRRSGEPRFKQVVEETFAYIRREMVHPDGGFYTAQDAGSEGHEGKYFVWEPAEIKAVLGSDLGEIFCRVYDITDHGNFEDKNIPNLIHANGRIEVTDLPDAGQVMADARRKLLEVRERRGEAPPGREKLTRGGRPVVFRGPAAPPPPPPPPPV